jgi:hypothetical protein
LTKEIAGSQRPVNLSLEFSAEPDVLAPTKGREEMENAAEQAQ